MIALLLPLAHAWELSGQAWPTEQLPLEIHWTGAQEGFTAGEVAAAIEGAAAAWTEAAPCGFELVVVEDPEAEAWFDAGGVAVFVGDPREELGEGTVSLVVSGPSEGEPFTRNGVTFEPAAPIAIVFNDGPWWATDAAIDAANEAGTCSDLISLQAALTHELGHLAGLAHTCELGEPCDDAAALDATMNASQEACSTDASTLGADDIAGIAAIYAEPVSFECASEPDDPMTVTCALLDGDTLPATWAFGDGETAEGATVSHTYSTEGTHTIELCVELSCGEIQCWTEALYVGPLDTGESADTEESADTPTSECDGCATTSGGGGFGWLIGLSCLVRRRS